MYYFLLRAHSGWRWIVLATIIIAIVIAISNMSKGNTYASRKFALWGLISTHIQALFGLVLYFMSPKVNFGEDTMADSTYRFFTVEHMLMMVIGIILITMGYSKAKKAINGDKTVFWFYLIGLLVILSRIPWPSMGLGASWF